MRLGDTLGIIFCKQKLDRASEINIVTDDSHGHRRPAVKLYGSPSSLVKVGLLAIIWT